MNLHCIGDSHCAFFLGYDHMPDEYPQVTRSLFRNVFCHRLGPSLAYNAYQYGTTTRTREKIETLLSELDSRSDIILLSFGEIDCRAHILKQCQQTGKSLNDVVKGCVDNYWQLIEHIRSSGFRVVVWNAVYSANFMELNPNLEYPYYGTVQQRNEATECFNRMLANRAAETSIGFLDITNHLLDASGNTTNSAYYFDSIHLNQKLFVRVMMMLNSKMPDPVFSKWQFVSYPLRLAMKQLDGFLRNKRTKLINRIQHAKDRQGK
jgi:hypothetical protein